VLIKKTGISFFFFQTKMMAFIIFPKLGFCFFLNKAGNAKKHKKEIKLGI
jgi:hypothetical protein